MRVGTQLRPAVLITMLLVLAGCGDDPAGMKTGPSMAPDWAGYEQYQRRCERLNLVGARARVLYEARKEMTRGDSSAVTAAVTLDNATPADRVLRRVGAAEEPGLIVSCRIEARLSASQYEFALSETDWVARSLLTTDTARWTWFVTPKVGGTHTLVLNLRPIMRQRAADSSTEASVSAESLNVQEYDTTVHVNVPGTERLQETMSRLAATFNIAEGLVTAITALLAAVVAFGAVLGIRRRRKRRAEA